MITSAAPSSIEVLVGLGKEHDAAGQHHAAAFCYHEALQQSLHGLEGARAVGPSEQLVLLFHLGVQRLLLGQHREGLACFKGSQAALSAKHQLWLRLAECIVGSSAPLGAIQRITAAMDQPGGEVVMGGTAEQDDLSLAMQWLQRAQQQLEKRLGEPPEDPEILEQLQGDLHQVQCLSAIASFRKRAGADQAVTLQPEDLSGQIVESSDIRAVQLLLAAEAAVEKRDLRTASASFTDAISVLQQAGSEATTNGGASETQDMLAIAQYNMAALRLQQGHLDEAHTYAEAAGHRDVSHRAACTLLAQIKMHSGNLSASTDLLKQYGMLT